VASSPSLEDGVPVSCSILTDLNKSASSPIRRKIILHDSNGDCHPIAVLFNVPLKWDWPCRSPHHLPFPERSPRYVRIEGPIATNHCSLVPAALTNSVNLAIAQKTEQLSARSRRQDDSACGDSRRKARPSQPVATCRPSSRLLPPNIAPWSANLLQATTPKTLSSTSLRRMPEDRALQRAWPPPVLGGPALSLSFVVTDLSCRGDALFTPSYGKRLALFDAPYGVLSRCRSF